MPWEGPPRSALPYTSRSNHELSQATRDQPINLLSALLALATGVIHASLAPLLAMGDVRPNLILAAVVAATALAGLGAGTLWAFVAGLSANLLTTDPLGTVPLGLLLVSALVAVLSRLFRRPGVGLALVGGLLGSAVLDLLVAAVLTLEGNTLGMDAGALVALVAPTAIINATLSAGLFLAGRAAIGRLAPTVPASLG